MNQYTGREETKNTCPSRKAGRMSQFLGSDLTVQLAKEELYDDMI